MPHPDCYTNYIRGWPTNDGGDMIGDPRKEPRIIPALEREEIQVGSFPHSMKDVRPDMLLDPATVVAVWEEKHIAVARMLMCGSAITLVRKSKQMIEKEEKRTGAVLKGKDIFSPRPFLSGSVGIYTRDMFDECISEMKDNCFPAFYSLRGGRAVRVIGCILYIHSQTD